MAARGFCWVDEPELGSAAAWKAFPPFRSISGTFVAGTCCCVTPSVPGNRFGLWAGRRSRSSEPAAAGSVGVGPCLGG